MCFCRRSNIAITRRRARQKLEKQMNFTVSRKEVILVSRIVSRANEYAADADVRHQYFFDALQLSMDIPLQRLQT